MKSYRERNRQRQTRLAFQSLDSSSPVKNEYSPAVKDRLATVRFEGGTPRRSLRPADTTTVTLPTPEPSSQPQNVPEPESEDEDDIVLPSSKRRRVSPVKDADTPTRKSGRLQEASSGRKPRAVPSSPPRFDLEELGSPETSGDDELVMTTKPTQRRRSKAVNDDPFLDDEPAPGSATRKKGDDFVVNDDEVEYISSDEDVRPAKKKKSRTRRSRREQDELDDDLEDLKTSDVEEDRDRTRGGIVNKKRDQAREYLELLKRRRAGEKIPRVTDSDDEHYGFDENDGADIDNIVEATIWPIADHPDLNSESDADQDPEPVHDDKEDDFIVNDDSEQESGRARDRPLNGIPIEFTSFAKQKPRELFIHVVEWLVKNKIAPAFSRDDELYRLSWNKINDQIKAQAGSRLISSAWDGDFKNAIMARPDLTIVFISDGSDDSYLDCDACKKTNHPARYQFKFTGQAYDPNTLEPLNEEDASDDEEADRASYDFANHLLPSSDTLFLLGRFCAANAEMGHKLTHWKFHLNERLLTHLEEQGVLSADAIVAREKKSKKKREKEAEQIVDHMDDTGMVHELWTSLQGDLEDARFGMEDHVSRKGRNRARVGKVRVQRNNETVEEWSEGGKLRVTVQSDSE